MEDNEEFMLTTTDNPYNPWLQWDQWYAFDTRSGYNTCALLARITKTSSELSDEEILIDMHDAVKRIIGLNLSGKHVVVTRKSFENRMKEIVSPFPIKN